MERHLTGCHLPYGITQCNLPRDTSKHTPPESQPDKLVLDLPTSVTRPSTNPAAHVRESNSQPVDHKSDVQTTMPPSHPSTVKVFYSQFSI